MVEILFYDVRQSLASPREAKTVQRKRRTHGGVDIPLLEKQFWKMLHKEQIRLYLTRRELLNLKEINVCPQGAAEGFWPTVPLLKCFRPRWSSAATCYLVTSPSLDDLDEVPFKEGFSFTFLSQMIKQKKRGKKSPATQAAQWYGRGKLQNDNTSTLVSVSVTICGSLSIGKNHSFGMYILETWKKINCTSKF